MGLFQIIIISIFNANSYIYAISILKILELQYNTENVVMN